MPDKNKEQVQEKISVPEHGFLSKEIEDALTIIEDSTVGGMGFAKKSECGYIPYFNWGGSEKQTLTV
jgi:hypothetical protein